MSTNKIARRKGTALRLAALTTTALVGLAMAPSAYGQEWKGTTSKDWFDDSNWSTGQEPTAADNATVNSTGTDPRIAGVGNGAYVNNLTIGGSGGGTATVEVESGGALNASQIIIGDKARGSLDVGGVGSAFASYVNTSGSMIIGKSDFGAMFVGNGTVTSGSVILGQDKGSLGNVIVSGTNAKWFNNGFLTVGETGDGKLDILNGGAVTSAVGTIGAETGAMGSVTVDGAGSSWSNSNVLYVGFSGNGTLVISNGGAVSNSIAYIGGNLDSTGTVTVTGAKSTWMNSGDLTVGNNSKGTLNVLNGGNVSNVNGVIGQYVIGDATVAGAGSMWSNSGSLKIGAAKDGSLTILSGGAVTSATGMVGEVTGSKGIVAVDGLGSNWVNTADLYIGQDGSGSINITNAGNVFAGFTSVGSGTTGVGALNVDGTDSMFDSSGNLTIGGFGTGSMSITNGGAVESVSGVIGSTAGATGTVTVDGTDSLWSSSDFLYVGNSGDGSLNITHGSQVYSTLGAIAVADVATGKITVDGADSTLTTAGQLIVGVNGRAELFILNGAKVDTSEAAPGASATIAASNSSVGNVVVDGVGSAWGIDAELVIGQNGDASLTVANGGLVAANGGIRIAQSAGSFGSLNIGDGGAAGAVIAPTVQFGAGFGRIQFNHTDAAYDFSAAISGAGTIYHNAGVTYLTGNSGGFTGDTHLNGGTLYVNGQLGGGTIDTQSGATLTGFGSIGGKVQIYSGGTILGAQGQTLTMGSLILNDGANVAVTFNTPGGAALFDVTNDLTLDGTLNITSGGTFGPGVYKLINYGGVLTDNGLDIGATPMGYVTTDFLIQTSVAGQVNLVNNSLPNLLFWDGDKPGAADNNVVDGGTGTWSNVSTNWTDANGLANGMMHPQPGFAIFQAMPGTVTVDGSAGAVGVTGMQFASDGYVITGASITLAESDTTVRVGDGSAAGSAFKATISSVLTGPGALVKTDLGTLILTADNDFTGSTSILGGTLQLGDGGTTGSVMGSIVNNGVLIFNRSDASVFAGEISGNGLLTQAGAGKTSLSGDSSIFTGLVRVDGGTLALLNGGKLGASNVFVAYDAGSTASLSLDGAGTATTTTGPLVIGIAGNGSLSIGSGATMTAGETVLGAVVGSQGTALIDGAGSKLTAGDLYVGGGTSGTITVSNNGSLVSKTGYLGYDTTAQGSVTVTGAGSSWAATAIGVGVNGTGTLNILNGGVATTGGSPNSGGSIGAGANSQGFANVNGAGSAWLNSGDLFVGAAGNGNLTVGNGAKVTNVYATIGDQTGSVGSATVTGAGSTWTSSETMYVGRDGTAKLVIANGAVVTDKSAGIGVGASGTGTVSVDGAGSVWNNGAGLIVAQGGTGSLAITNGGKVLGDLAYVGGLTGSKGVVSIDGAGSSWTNTGALYLGNDGTGSMSITKGGSASNAVAYLGYGAGSKGSVLVDGAGSIWTSANLAVGGAGEGSLTVTNGGTVRNDSAAVASAAGVNSKVIVDGAGSSWVSNGQVIIGQFGNGTLLIANGAAVSATGPMTLAATAGSSGVLNIGAAAGSPAAAAGTLNVASLQFGSGAGVLNFNHTAPNYTFGTAMVGTGTINQLAGVTNLTANSNGFIGAVNVTVGKLYVNGGLAGGKVTVGNGATLGGNGLIGSLAAQSGSIIAPGNSIGTLNVAGNATFASGSTYQVELNSAGQSDLIKVTGTAAIANGALLSLTKTDAAPYSLGAHYTVLTADGGLTGKFNFTNVQLTNFVGLVSGSDAKSFFVDVAKTKTFASAAGTPNQKATAGALDGMPLSSKPVIAVAGLMSDAQAQGAYDQLSGEIHATAKSVLVQDSRLVREAAIDRLRTADGQSGAVWGRALGGWSKQSGDGNAAGVTSNLTGLLLGADAGIGDKIRVGAVGSYSRSSFHVDARNSSGTSDNYGVGIYAGATLDKLAVRVGGAYSWNSLNIGRTVGFTGFADSLSSKYKARTAQVFGELSYGIEAGSVTLEPFANLAYVNLSTDAFAEKGGTAALTGRKGSTGVTFTTLGTRAAKTFSLGNDTSLTARATAGWRHASDNTTTTTVNLAGSAPFTIGGLPIAKDMGVVDLGLDLKLSKGVNLGVSYAGQYGSGASDQTVRATLSIKF